jgi:hypothetical protein
MSLTAIYASSTFFGAADGWRRARAFLRTADRIRARWAVLGKIKAPPKRSD